MWISKEIRGADEMKGMLQIEAHEHGRFTEVGISGLHRLETEERDLFPIMSTDIEHLEVIDVDTTAIEVIYVDACIFPGLQCFFTFEGKDWYPINVDEGSSEDDTIDVEAWTTLSEAPGSWTANDEDTAVPSSSEVWAKVRAANVDIFQCCICFSTPNKLVM
ncbi:hypothetical protein C8J57DRAFT_1231295 [Mycena rebaudengoi]|nr:hypothetical protein C8J57DRAFT_1231295 [Mycena rebaudengoi]